jgi:signal transduction histidine kinase/ActR/RegA family two-component response regulator
LATAASAVTGAAGGAAHAGECAAVLIVDAAGVVTYVNAAFEDATGCAAAGMLHRPLAHAEGLDAKVSEAIGTAIKQDADWCGRIRLPGGKDRTRELQLTASPIRDERRRITGCVAVGWEVIQDAAFEAQLRQAQKLEAIGTLASGISHDFNNLLFAILGYAELIQDELTPGSVAATNMEELMAAAKRARGLVQQLLTFSRQSQPQPVVVNMALLLGEAVRFLRSVVPSTIEIRPYIETNELPVLADPTELHQVVMNLATNAYQAIGSQPGTMRIGLRPALIGRAEPAAPAGLAPGQYAEISVQDTGTGMPAEVLARAFEPFFTTKEPGRGTGLGLATVHGIVTRLGGAVNARSEIGQGSTFTVYLPVCAEQPGVAALPASGLPAGTERIMLVDDEYAVANMIRQMLVQLGYDVRMFGSSFAALTYFTDDPSRVDLLITDQAMPMRSGLELAQEVLSIRPGLPVLLCTGVTSVEPARAARVGISGLITKPVSRTELAHAVRRALDESRGDAPQ